MHRVLVGRCSSGGVSERPAALLSEKLCGLLVPSPSKRVQGAKKPECKVLTGTLLVMTLRSVQLHLLQKSLGDGECSFKW